MSALSTAVSRGKASRVTNFVKRSSDLETLPLPWPAAGVSPRDARRPHSHRCINCADHYLCLGPDLSGQCAPICGPCMWVELGVQLRTYQSMAEAIEQRRRKIEAQFGAAACRKSQGHRRQMLRHRNVVSGFGGVVLKGGAENEDSEEASSY